MPKNGAGQTTPKKVGRSLGWSLHFDTGNLLAATTWVDHWRATTGPWLGVKISGEAKKAGLDIWVSGWRQPKSWKYMKVSGDETQTDGFVLICLSIRWMNGLFGPLLGREQPGIHWWIMGGNYLSDRKQNSPKNLVLSMTTGRWDLVLQIGKLEANSLTSPLIFFSLQRIQPKLVWKPSDIERCTQ